MRIALVLLFLLCGVGVFAESQPPAPTPFKVSYKPEEKTKYDQGKAEYDKRGTKYLPFVVETLEGDSGAAEKDRNAKHREKEASNSGHTMLFTGGLLIVAICQLGFFLWQLRLMRQNIRDTEKAAGAANKSAISAEISTQSFIKAERPYVFVTVIHEAYTRDGTEGIYRYKATNHGKTPAIITCNFGHIHIGDNEPANIAENTDEFIPRGGVVIGASESDIFSVIGEFDIIAAANIENGAASRKLYCHGIIKYTDIFGDNPHFTKFCWVFDNRGYEKGFYVTCNKKLNECT